MQAVVLGAGGQLGVEIVRELRTRGHSVMGVGRSQLDITVSQAVQALLSRYRPRWVINCAAYNQVDLAEREPEKAMRINGLAVRTISIACQQIGATLLHYSTDHVFDGSKDSPYVEDDLPSPPSAYAVSKLAGEHYARSNCDKSFVVRVAGVFGPAGRYTNRGNFLELILNKAAAKEPLKVVDDFFATPTYAVPLAARSLDLLEKAPFGTFHIGGGETVSWYDWARKILAAAELETELSPTNHREFVTAARRPRHASLSNAKVEALGLAKMPSLDESLADYLRRRAEAHTP